MSTDLLAVASEQSDWVGDAYAMPERTACEFSIYPLGDPNYEETVRAVLASAGRSPAWKEDKSDLCFILDGNGCDVFDCLQSSFQLARRRQKGVGVGEGEGEGEPGCLVMTVTLTANLAKWKGGL